MTVYFHRDDERGPDERFEEGDIPSLDAALARFREAVTSSKAQYACLEWIHVHHPTKADSLDPEGGTR